MQEMIELSKLQQEQPENPPRVVSFLNPNELKNGQPTTTTIQAGPAQFGLDLKGDVQVQFSWRRDDDLKYLWWFSCLQDIYIYYLE